jgi:hypothetical protein
MLIQKKRKWRENMIIGEKIGTNLAKAKRWYYWYPSFHGNFDEAKSLFQVQHLPISITS